MEATHMATKTKLGYENKETIFTESAQTIRELITVLENFVARANNDADVVYVESGEADGVIARLIENTLTDGSKTYDVRIS
jgi:hypothetical protein